MVALVRSVFSTHKRVYLPSPGRLSLKRGGRCPCSSALSPHLAGVHFTERSRDILECNEATGEGLDDVYILTSDEESLRLQDLVQATLAEEVTPWDSLQHRQRQKASSRYDCAFSVCVLVVGSTLLSTRDKQNLVISDLNLPGKSDVTPRLSSAFTRLFTCILH